MESFFPFHSGPPLPRSNDTCKSSVADGRPTPKSVSKTSGGHSPHGDSTTSAEVSERETNADKEAEKESPANSVKPALFNSLARTLPIEYHNAVAQTDAQFKIGSLYCFLAWLALVTIVYCLAPAESFVVHSEVEKRAATLAFLTLSISFLTRILPLLYWERKSAFSGVIVGVCTVQFIAVATDAMMAFLPTPVLTDPVTHLPVRLLRWCEWAPLSALMTLLTEGVDIPHIRYGTKTGVLHAFIQGASTLMGLLLPTASNFTVWCLMLVTASVLYCFIFVRLHSKYAAFCNASPGASVDEIELYDRARLSFKLLATCCVTWTVLIALHFVSSFAHRFVAKGSILTHPAFPMIQEAFCEVLSKVLYLLIVLDVHRAVFDESAKAERRLNDLRQMMSVVWESSSDVIAISVQSAVNGNISTMVSPTYLKLEKALGRQVEKKCDATTDKKSSELGTGSICLDDKAAETTSNAATASGRDAITLVFELEVEDVQKKVIDDMSEKKDSAAFLASSQPELAKEKSVKDFKNDSTLKNKADISPIPKRVHFVRLYGSTTRDHTQNRCNSSVSALRFFTNSASNVHGLSSPGVVAMGKLLAHAWKIDKSESILMHDFEHYNPAENGLEEELVTVRCEAKITRLEPNALVLVVRDISERFKRFEAEKKVVVDLTARQKDAEANRFTRHEVKNGLLAAIGLCDGLREAFGNLDSREDPGAEHQWLDDKIDSDITPVVADDRSAGEVDSEKIRNQPCSNVGGSDQCNNQLLAELLTSASNKLQRKIQDGSMGSGVKFDVRMCVLELDSMLRDVLDTILAQSMVKDVVHEVYEPKIERVDIQSVLFGARSSVSEKPERFPLATFPSPLPPFMLDPQLLRFVHRNAIANACKYGRKGGVVLTEVHFDIDKSEIQMTVVNLPGDHHEEIMKMGKESATAVFSSSVKLHSAFYRKNGYLGVSALSELEEETSHSLGDSAWIMRKCAKILGGECNITFETTRTVFTLRCPAITVETALKENSLSDPIRFCLPPNTWGVAIDDSKIQRKLLERLFTLIGVEESKRVVLGKDVDEIRSFSDFVVDVVRRNSNDYLLLIADENLDIVVDATRHNTVSGSRCVESIRNNLEPDEEMRMLALVRSANDSSDEIAVYNQRAHGFLPKAPIQKDRVLETIAPLWKMRFETLSSLRDDSSSNFLAMERTQLSSTETFSAQDVESNGEETFVSSADIASTVEAIDALCQQEEDASSSSPPNHNKHWPKIWEKLHVLKGDMKTLKYDDCPKVTAVSEAIDYLQGIAPPDDLFEKWISIRSIVLSLLMGRKDLLKTEGSRPP